MKWFRVEAFPTVRREVSYVNVLVAGESSALADATVELLTDGDRRRSLARSVRDTVAETYAPEAVADELESNLGLRDAKQGD